MSQSQSPNPKQNPSTSTLPDVFGGEDSLESPDVLLTKFLRSTEIVANPGGPTPQQTLKTILNDPRWTRRMLEDWFKKGPISRQPVGTLTPDPEFRAIYLILLGMLEAEGRHGTGLGESNVQTKEPETKEEKEEWEREIRRRTGAWRKEQGIE